MENHIVNVQFIYWHFVSFSLLSLFTSTALITMAILKHGEPCPFDAIYQFISKVSTFLFVLNVFLSLKRERH
jgi:hypothetical protein